MIRLFGAELRRIAARRLVRLTLVLAAIGVVGGGVLAYATTHPLSESAYQQRVRQAETAREAQRTAIDACLQAHGQTGAGEIPDNVARQCFPKKNITAKDPRFHRTRLKGVLQGVSGVLLIVGWALGASIVGAEFASRSMTTLLTWETRRSRVLVAKALSVALTAAVFATVVLLLVTAALLPALLAHSAPITASEPGLATIAGVIGRGVALATLGAVMGFAIAAIGRNTATALGVGFAYIVILENILGNSIAGWRRWLLLGNVIVFVSGRASSDVAGRSVTGAAIFLTIVAVVLLVMAVGSFRLRDIA
jgi:hypothetical protein